MLARNLTDLHVAGEAGKLTHFAYADDVTLILTQSTDIATMRENIHLYEQASEAKINARNPKLWPSEDGTRRKIYLAYHV
jgi:accessory colonization factor AcfC